MKNTNEFYLYTHNYHKLILIVFVIGSLLGTIIKCCNYGCINVDFICRFGSSFNELAHILCGAFVCLVFYLSIRFLTRKLTNIYVKTFLLVCIFFFSLLFSALVESFLSAPCTNSGCADKVLLDGWFTSLGVILMFGITLLSSLIHQYVTAKIEPTL